MKILIADDSIIIRHRLKQMIAELPDIDVIFETDGIMKTMAGIHENRPDVLILDIRMPDGCGIDVLKAMDETSKPPVVIVFTNFPCPQYRNTCLTCGADYFFDKSTDIEELVAVIGQRAEQKEIAS